MARNDLDVAEPASIEVREHLSDTIGFPMFTNAVHLPRSVSAVTSGGALMEGRSGFRTTIRCVSDASRPDRSMRRQVSVVTPTG